MAASLLYVADNYSSVDRQKTIIPNFISKSNEAGLLNPLDYIY